MKVTGLDTIQIEIEEALDPDVVRIAILDMYGKMRERIFTDGIAADGSEIGKYSTEPIYVNPKNSPKKFAPKGKTGNTKFADGKAHKTRYFEQGYKGFRAKAGRQTSKVDLRLSGNLRNSFLPDFSKDDPVIGFRTDHFGEIAKGNEERFNTLVFANTDEELDDLVKNLQRSI